VNSFHERILRHTGGRNGGRVEDGLGCSMGIHDYRAPA
jgi:hypothetical protein